MSPSETRPLTRTRRVLRKIHDALKRVHSAPGAAAVE